MDIPGSSHDLYLALKNDPAVLLIVLCLNVAGLFLQAALPVKLNKIVAAVLLLCGVVLAILLVPADIFPKTQQHPKVLLGIIGFLLGAISWWLHGYPLQWATAWFKAKLPNDIGSPHDPVK